MSVKVSVVGSGYVGTTLSACLAELGHQVVTVDIDESIVQTINSGESPIHEPGLNELVAHHSGENLIATTDYDTIKTTDLTFLAIQTPSNEDGSINLSAITSAAEMTGEALSTKDGTHTVVVKSTVTPGSTQNVLGSTIAEAAGETLGEDIHVAMNPEFLREGSAVRDFQNPDKVVIGAETEQSRELLHEVFEPLYTTGNDDLPIVETGIREAEMVKYANNAFLAAKISLINEIGNICKEHDVDAYEIADAIGLDSRIERSFLDSGLGWGGSCFPKDVKALIEVAKSTGYDPSLLESVVEVNDKQPERMLELLRKHTEPNGKRIAVLGLAFKPGTDDVRNSRAIPVIEGLLELGAEVVAYDPVANSNMQAVFPQLEYTDSAATALAGTSAALVVTDWDEFATLDAEFEEMESAVVIDGRHIVTNSKNVTYDGLTWTGTSH